MTNPGQGNHSYRGQGASRRAVLRLAGGIAATLTGGGAVLAAGGCRDGAAEERAGGRLVNDILVVELTGGALAAIDTGGGQTRIGAGTGVLSGDGSRLVLSNRPNSTPGTTMTIHRLADGQTRHAAPLTGRLVARAASADGSLVALVADGTGGAGAGGAGAGGIRAGNPYQPGPRARTTIVVADSDGERARLELPGNLEPEAFDLTGHRLFVLDYLPPLAPDRYRVRAVEVSTGRLLPLNTRAKSPVPSGAEEEMRGEGRQAVYDPATRQLFTLYTHQPEHQHTRDLIRGARQDAPHVHAFVHTLSLTEGWAYCVDLPAPFGEGPPDGHALTLSPAGDRLWVVDASKGAAAAIDPQSLAVTSTVQFPSLMSAATGGATDAFTTDAFTAARAAALATEDGILVAAGRQVLTIPPSGGQPTRQWATDGTVRGLARSARGDQLYVGQDDAVLRLDPATGATRQRIPVPGLVALRHATTQR